MANFKKLDFSSGAKVDDVMVHSNLKYNMDGQMFFNDELYLTKWHFNQSSLKSETLFNSLQGESFEFDELDSLRDLNWNQFGFVQDFYDAATGDMFSPFHRNQHLELYYVSEGSFRMKLQRDFVELSAGDVLLINAHVNHSDVFTFKPLKLFILGMNEACFDDYFLKVLDDDEVNNFIKRSFLHGYNTSEYLIFNVENHKDDLNRLFEALSFEMIQREIAYEKMVTAQLLRIFDQITDNAVVKEYTEAALGRKSLIFDEVDRYMKHHYADMNLDDLSNYMRFSKDYFNRLIKGVTGFTYMEYLQKIRIDQAKLMLIQSGDNVQDIATHVGYQNLSHFYKVFKAQMGLTPNEYRNANVVIRQQ